MNWSQQMLAIKLQLAGWDVTRSTVAKIEARVIWVGDFQMFYFIHDTITKLMEIRM